MSVLRRTSLPATSGISPTGSPSRLDPLATYLAEMTKICAQDDNP